MNIYVYIAFYAMMFILSIFSYRTKDQRKQKMFFVIMCISFFLFYGIRDESIGTDTKTYLRYYKLQNVESYQNVERAFYLLSKLCWTIHLPLKAYIAILTLIVTVVSGILYYVAFADETQYLCLAYFCMLCLPYSIMMYINVVRQGIAISFIFLGVILLDKGKKKMAVPAMLIGCLFHYMSIGIVLGFIIYYLIKNERFLQISAILVTLAGIIVGSAGIGEKILKLIPSNHVTKRVLCYLDEPVTKNQIVRLIFYLVIFCTILIVMIRYQIDMSNMHKLMLVLLTLTGLGVSCMTVAFRYSISLDMMMPLLFLQPELLSEIERKDGIVRKKVYIGVYIAFSIAMYIFGIVSNPVKTNMGF